MKKTRIYAVIGIFIISFGCNFAFKLFPNVLFSCFFPVNESIWEHMKILFTAPIIYAFIDYFILKKKDIKVNNFVLNLFSKAALNIPIYLLMFLPLYKIFGENMFISISLMIVTYVITELIFYKLFTMPYYKSANIISILAIFIMYLVFIYLTYNPPKVELFRDPENNGYGIIDLKNKK